MLHDFTPLQVEIDKSWQEVNQPYSLLYDPVFGEGY